MLAIIFLTIATYFGDRLCRRFYRFTSIGHRLATAFIVGILISGWITYLGSLAFAFARQPLIFGNLLFLLVFALVCYKVPRCSLMGLEDLPRRQARSVLFDRIWFAVFAVLACWLMFSTLNFKDGRFYIAFKSWADFGANVSLVQSFVLGHNFPPQHPFFAGEIIRYHFLFWFQAANLEFLGLNPVWSVNLLSILSLLSLLTLITTFGEVVFRSRVAGRIAACLFFFSSSLSYLPFLKSQDSVAGALNSIFHSNDYLGSGYPWRGETWGVLSANLFAYQRHLISGIGVLFVVMILVCDRYRILIDGRKDKESPPGSSSDQSEAAEMNDRAPGFPEETSPIQSEATAIKDDFQAQPKGLQDLKAFIFSGALIGLLPYWNSPVFVAALAICGCALLLFPYRLYVACLIGAAVVLGLPQVLLLRSAHVASESIFHWGYVLSQPTVWQVVKYLGWTFGLKWILIAVTLVLTSGFHRRFMLALLSLLAIVFILQLSPDVFNNHKLLNVWASFANVYAGYALWRIGKIKIIGMALAIVLTVSITLTGVIDLFPLHNDSMLTVPYQNDRLTSWILANTKPSDVFLTPTFLTHPIVFAGRKIFLGYTLFAWTAGYDVGPRDSVYHSMFREKDFSRLTRLLNDNHISYVAIDDGVRHNTSLVELNESVYQKYFEKVFEDTEHHYDNLEIYKVPNSMK